MSTLQVANLHFESTGNSRLQYTGSNGYILVGGGSNVAVINSTAIYFPLNLNINNFTVNAITVSNTITGTDMTLSGNLIVSGSLTYVNTTTLNIGDNIITLNADLPPASAPSENAGFEINRGSSANVQLRWNETNDLWQTTSDGTNYYNITTSANTANATVAGVITVVDSVTNVSILTAASANSVKNAYDRAIDANTRASSAQTAADQAYSNAIAYSGNAVQAYTNAVSVASSDATSKAATAYSNAIATASSDATSKAATAYSNAVSTAASDATSKAATAYSNAITWSGNAAAAYTNAITWSGNAALAYSNAVSTAASDATSKAATAYSNAIAYSGNAAQAYTNAMANTLTRSATYTGNNTFSGSNTVIGNLNVTGTFLNVASAFVVNSTGAYHTGKINAASYTVTSANLVISSNGVSFGGISGPAIIFANTGAFTVGNSSSTQSGSGITFANTLSSASMTPTGFSGNGGSLTNLNASNITTGTLPWSQAPTGTVNTSGAFTRTGNTTFNANVILGSSSVAVGLQANGSYGTAGQILTSNGTATYWRSAANTANNIAGGSIGAIPYQFGSGITDFVALGDVGQYFRVGPLGADWESSYGYVLSSSGSSSSFDFYFDTRPWVQKITLIFSGQSLGWSMGVRLGDSGGFETSGYNTVTSIKEYSGAGTTGANNTGYFAIPVTTFAEGGNMTGIITLERPDTITNTKTWYCNGVANWQGVNYFATFNIVGDKTTSGTTDRVRLFTVGTGSSFGATAVYAIFE